MIGKLLKYWWVQPLVYIGFLFILWVSIIHAYDCGWWYDILVIFILLTGFLQFVIACMALIKKKFKIFLFVCLGILLSFFLSSGFAFFAPYVAGESDHFGREHPIPATLAYTMPFPDTLAFNSIQANALQSGTHLQICNGSQQGIYEYVYFAPPLPDGVIFLKCFEVTENIPLSEESIKKSTVQPVRMHHMFSKIGKSMEFTIYEGIWDEPYAVRVEVWFKANTDSPEKKLTGKIYKMEGWMR